MLVLTIIYWVNRRLGIHIVARSIRVSVLCIWVSRLLFFYYSTCSMWSRMFSVDEFRFDEFLWSRVAGGRLNVPHGSCGARTNHGITLAEGTQTRGSWSGYLRVIDVCPVGLPGWCNTSQNTFVIGVGCCGGSYQINSFIPTICVRFFWGTLAGGCGIGVYCFGYQLFAFLLFYFITVIWFWLLSKARPAFISHYL